MTKEQQTFKIWAVHDGRRTLMHVIEEPHGRERALRAVDALKLRPEIDAIELREHVVSVPGDPAEPPHARRGTLRWHRKGDRWQQDGH
jgi:hypothetical protein